MSRRIISLSLLILLVSIVLLLPVAGQESVSNPAASPELITWITTGMSSEDALSLVDQITANEYNGVYDYWVTYSQGSYHIQYGGIVEGIRGE
jgi:hypothetical protein